VATNVEGLLAEGAESSLVVERRPPWIWRALAALIGTLPHRALFPLGGILAFLAFDVLRIRRSHVLHALDRAGLGGAKIARASYRSLGVGIFELLWLAGRPTLDLASLARVEGWSRFEEARALGRGVVVATAHTGNWDLAACACAARTPLAVVTKRLSSRGLDAFWQSSRLRRGLELLSPEGSIFRAVCARLMRGGSVALLVDQDPERTTSVVEAPFLGENALCDTLPAVLAARTGAPIVLAFARRAPHRRHVVEIVDVIIPPKRPGAAWIEETTRKIAAALDTFVREDPTQWMWLHRRWKTRHSL
jgi:KDO2-lipid IV(A) lauroyltransferase